MTTWAEAIRLAVRSQLNIVHTAFPGIIVEYDFATQKAVVQPALRKVYLKEGTPESPAVQDMPILNSVPVIFPRSGSTGISFPINAGDSCLIVISERAIDNWVNEGGQVTPNDPRQFNLSDAVCIPGLFPFSEPLPVQNNDDFVIQHAGSTVTIKANGDIILNSANKVAIAGLLGTVELLQQLVTFLNTFPELTSGPGPYPLVAAAAVTASSAIESIRATP